eukprot:gene56905-biopygen99210
MGSCGSTLSHFLPSQGQWLMPSEYYSIAKVNEGPQPCPGQLFDAATEQRLAEWVCAKRSKDFRRADAIRKELRKQGGAGIGSRGRGRD